MTRALWIIGSLAVLGLIYWGMVKIAKHMFGQ